MPAAVNHFTTAEFWKCYQRLPAQVREVADKNFQLLKADSKHPSLHFKRIDGLWSVHAGQGCRALALDKDEGVLWFWIGSHADYDKLLP